jgi:hypothetical protein
VVTSSTTTAVVAFGSKSSLPLLRPLSSAPAGLRRFFPMCCNQASIRQTFAVCMLVDGALEMSDHTASLQQVCT